MVKNPSAYAGGFDRLDPWVGKSPWRKKWQSTPVFLPGMSLCPWTEEPGRLQSILSKESNVTEKPKKKICLSFLIIFVPGSLLSLFFINFQKSLKYFLYKPSVSFMCYRYLLPVNNLPF